MIENVCIRTSVETDFKKLTFPSSSSLPRARPSEAIPRLMLSDAHINGLANKSFCLTAV